MGYWITKALRDLGRPTFYQPERIEDWKIGELHLLEAVRDEKG